MGDVTDTIKAIKAGEPLEAITPAAPVVFTASSASAVGGTAAGAVVILLGGIGTFMSFVKGHDVVALFNWFHGSDGASFAAAATLLGGIAWRLTASFRKHVKAVIAARSADDSVAVVKE